MDGRKIYYVSALRGDDNNDGLSEETPFRSLRKAAGQKREPGDMILLERGSVFQEEYLHIYEGGIRAVSYTHLTLPTT